MEAFSLLKYWKSVGNGGSDLKLVDTKPNNGENDNDDGPFFDLEFTVDDEEEEADQEEQEEEEEEEEGEEDLIKFTLSSSSPSGSNTDRTDVDQNLSLSLSVSPSTDHDQTSNAKATQFPVSSLVKSATKLRVFMSGLKKSKNSNNGGEKKSTEPSTAKQTGKFFTVKFKVDEVPIVSLFTRENSSRVASSKTTPKQNSTEVETSTTTTQTATTTNSSSSKEVMQKYLKMVKPLYVRVSRRYGHVSVNTSPTKPCSPPAPENPPAVGETLSGKAGLNLPAGLRVVCKHLGKSRSATVLAAAPASSPASGTASTKRRDDSLIQQQDGIQSAILHCKRSFNAVRDSETALLARCVSDPSNEKKSLEMSRKSSNDILQPL